MPEIWMDVDTAVVVPVNTLPLIDDTDFKTVEDAIVYNQAGMKLTWNFVTTAGVQTSTAVTPTTAGVHDWIEEGPVTDRGMYSCEIPASTGTVNNDTEGFGWWSGVCTGVLPWRGPIVGFRAAALNNALIDGGDNLDVNTVQWLGTACATPTTAGVPEVDVTHLGGATQSATDLKDFADDGYDPATNKVQGVVLVDTCTTNTDMVGTNSALLASSAPANFGDLSIDVTTGRVDVSKIEGVDATDQIRDSVVDDATRIDASQLNTHSALTAASIASQVDTTLTASHGAGSWAGGGDSTIVTGSAETGTTASTIETDLTEATNDHYAMLLFLPTSGAADGQARWIDSYNGTTKAITLTEEMTDTMSPGDTFSILALRGVNLGKEQ